MKDTKTLFDEGYDAAKEAKMLEDNPYPERTDEFDAWEDGWWAYFYEDDSDEE